MSHRYREVEIGPDEEELAALAELMASRQQHSRRSSRRVQQQMRGVQKRKQMIDHRSGTVVPRHFRNMKPEANAAHAAKSIAVQQRDRALRRTISTHVATDLVSMGIRVGYLSVA